MSKMRYISLGLAMAASMASVLPVNADCVTRKTYITPAQTIQVVPQSMIMPTYMPLSTTKTTHTTIVTPGAMIEPTIVTTPDSFSRTTVITGSAPASTSTTTMSAEIGPFPVFSNRLAAMNEQIDRSTANGWISSFHANSLRVEASRLGQVIANRSASLAESDALERGLTSLNIAIQDAMRAQGQTAGVNRPLN